MTGLRILVAAAALISAISPVSAGEGGPEVYLSQYPNRDAYTGELTPAGRLGLELPYGAAPNRDVIRAYGSMGNADPSFSPQAPHPGRHRREQFPRH
ncbi:MAG TPA: BA14K family protein [Bradyrhizobium sp.]|nr:BA14K family protein [Bradyrhizobium sp.]